MTINKIWESMRTPRLLIAFALAAALLASEVFSARAVPAVDPSPYTKQYQLFTHFDAPYASFRTVTASNAGGTSTRTFALTVTPPPPDCNPVSFASAGTVAVGNSPTKVVIGDFNEDGNQDLAVASFFDNNVSIRLGDGAGGFSGTTTIPVGTNPVAVRVADFNGDGHQDFITSNFNASSASVRFGDGAGGFSGTTEINAGPGPISIVLGDFNGDSKLDFATVNLPSNAVSIRLGDGAGGFSGTTQISVGSNPTFVAVGDFNGDGKQDLAVSNASANTVSIKLGDGAGGFSGTTTIPVGPNPQFLVIGDFNGDGKPDFATPSFNATTVSIRLGDGAGGFSGTTEVSAGPNPIFVAIGDFDTDGNQDLAVANLGSTFISIRLGDGAGGFTGTTDLTVGTSPGSIAVGDFNEDGKQDLAVANNGSASVSILLRRCPLTASLGNYPNTSVPLSSNATVMPDAVPTNTTSIAVSTSTSFKGTLAADPTTGMVRVTDARPEGTYPVTVTAYNADGTATRTFALTVTTPAVCNPVSFANASTLAVGNNPTQVVIGDFNEDGNQDLAVPRFFDNNVSIRLGDGAGGFIGTTTVPVGTNPTVIAIGDFNGDGHEDFITSNFNASSASVRFGNGTGGFSGTTDVDAGPGPISIALGDFNGDGKLDFAAANVPTNAVSIRLGDGAGGFSGTTQISVGSHPSFAAVGDFNGDGKQDLAVTNLDSSTVSIKLGNGTGGFSGTTTIPVGPGPQFLAIGDFNGDGKQDFATANYNAPTTSIRLGDGAGGFNGTTEVSVGTSSVFVAIGDFDSDGNQDLAVPNLGSNFVSIRLGDGTGGFSNAADLTVGTSPSSVAVGDFNEDGMQDLAVANNGSGTLSILLRQCVQSAPTITAMGVTRQANGVTSNSQIATVNDIEDAENTLAVTVNGSTSATVNSVTVLGISVDASGKATSDVSAACGATTTSFTLRVTDSNGALSEATLTVTVTAETTSPSITCPPNKVQSTDPNLCTAVVTYSNATATDNCSGVGTPSCSPASGSAFPKGVNTVTCVVSDASGNTASCTFTVTVNDTQPPVISCPADVTVNKPANACSAVVNYSTPSATDNCSTASVSCSPPPGASFPIGSTSVVCIATDAALNTASCSFTINVVNHAPSANAGGPYTVLEGGAVPVAASGNDADGDTLAFAWDLDNNGSFETSGQSATFSAATLDGPGSRIVGVQVSDGCGSSTIAQATVNVLNAAPTVGAITAPVDPNQVNTTINAGASFTDPGVLDTHTAVWNWGDGSSSAGIVNETNGSGSVSGSHIYAAAGVYTVALTVTDKDGGSGQAIFQYVVVYDPTAGFVTGGGWINSPAGAYAPDSSLTGRATFGFVSKYQHGATVPTGNTQFNFHVATMNFNSTSYDWLLIAGARAQYKGTGTINGTGNYGFMLTAIDGQINGGGGVDKFRIKIWNKVTGQMIYDNQMGAGDDASPNTALAGGSIVIHSN